MQLKQIFDVFSRRPRPDAKVLHQIPQTTRNRVFLWCIEVFGNRRGTGFSSSGEDYGHQLWEELHRRLQLRLGRGQLSDARQRVSDRGEDARLYLWSCEGAEFLDFLEDLFRVDCYFHVHMPEKEVVAELNQLLRVDNLPYHVTDFVKETVREVRDGPPPFGGRAQQYINTLAYPTVIMRDSEAAHAELVAPTLVLLQTPHFRNANAEYLAALEDYRKGDLGDCVTKCGSAFESVMKVICEKKRLTYKQPGNASTLVKAVVDGLNLNSYLENTLTTTATIRNKASTAHGAGVDARNVSRPLARYALHSAAAAMLLLAAEAGLEGV